MTETGRARELGWGKSNKMREKERLQNRKLQIVKELENPNLEKGQIENLEMELSDIIVKMAKIK